MMTRQDYERLAGVLSRAQLDATARADLAARLADTLEDENGSFDRERFVLACEPDGDASPGPVQLAGPDLGVVAHGIAYAFAYDHPTHEAVEEEAEREGAWLRRGLEILAAIRRADPRQLQPADFDGESGGVQPDDAAWIRDCAMPALSDVRAREAARSS